MSTLQRDFLINFENSILLRPTSHQSSVMTKYGLHPFIKCCKIYEDIMRAHIKRVIVLLEKDQKLPRKSIFVRPSSIITTQCYGGEFVSYQMHECHYGPIEQPSSMPKTPDQYYIYWQKRNSDIWKHVVRPFPKLQREFKKAGYYLVDHSDNAKGYNFCIKLYRNDPQSQRPMWHNLNVMPSDDIVTCEPQTDPIKQHRIIKLSQHSAFELPLRSSSRSSNGRSSDQHHSSHLADHWEKDHWEINHWEKDHWEKDHWERNHWERDQWERNHWERDQWERDHTLEPLESSKQNQMRHVSLLDDLDDVSMRNNIIGTQQFFSFFNSNFIKLLAGNN